VLSQRPVQQPLGIGRAAHVLPRGHGRQRWLDGRGRWLDGHRRWLHRRQGRLHGGGRRGRGQRRLHQGLLRRRRWRRGFGRGGRARDLLGIGERVEQRVEVLAQLLPLEWAPRSARARLLAHLDLDGPLADRWLDRWRRAGGLLLAQILEHVAEDVRRGQQGRTLARPRALRGGRCGAGLVFVSPIHARYAIPYARIVSPPRRVNVRRKPHGARGLHASVIIRPHRRRRNMRGGWLVGKWTWSSAS
jgi:hypothetical protein